MHYSLSYVTVLDDARTRSRSRMNRKLRPPRRRGLLVLQVIQTRSHGRLELRVAAGTPVGGLIR
jgi:hypothetical protein